MRAIEFEIFRESTSSSTKISMISYKITVAGQTRFKESLKFYGVINWEQPFFIGQSWDMFCWCWRFWWLVSSWSQRWCSFGRGLGGWQKQGMVWEEETFQRRSKIIERKRKLINIAREWVRNFTWNQWEEETLLKRGKVVHLTIFSFWILFFGKINCLYKVSKG